MGELARPSHLPRERAPALDRRAVFAEKSVGGLSLVFVEYFQRFAEATGAERAGCARQQRDLHRQRIPLCGALRPRLGRPWSSQEKLRPAGRGRLVRRLRWALRAPRTWPQALESRPGWVLLSGSAPDGTRTSVPLPPLQRQSPAPRSATRHEEPAQPSEQRQGSLAAIRRRPGALAVRPRSDRDLRRSLE